MFHVIFGGSRLVVRTLGPALILFAVCVPAFADVTSGPRSIVGIALFEAIVLTAALGVLWPRRFGWAGRVVAAAAAFGWAALAADVLRRGVTVEAVVGLIVGFVVFGLPGARYAVQGERRAQLVAEATSADAASREAPATGSAGEVFASKLEWLLATYPHLRADVALDRGSGTVTFHRADDSGFYVGVIVGPSEVSVHAGLAHVHFTGVDPSRIAAGALACVMDLLGPDHRLRERLAGGRPYLARIEVRTPDGWRTVTTTGLLFWNYFGKREERILQNHALPARARPA